MKKVKNLMAAGAPLSDAVRTALGDKSLADVALEENVSRQNLTSALNGSRAPTVAEINAMVNQLGGTFEQWREAFADASAARVRAVAPAQ